MIAPAKPRRKKVRLTARQRAQVEKLYPMAIAMGRRLKHKDADEMDRAHDAVLGMASGVRSYKPGKTSLRSWAWRIGVGHARVCNGKYSLIPTPYKAYREADEATRRSLRTHSGLEFLGEESPVEEEDERSSALLAALRKLDDRRSDAVVRHIVGGEALSSIAEDLGGDRTSVHNEIKRTLALLRHDRGLCKAMGVESFFDSIPDAPAEEASIPNRGGMRPAAAFLRSKGGTRSAAVLARLAGRPKPLESLCLDVAETSQTLSWRLRRLVDRGFVAKRAQDGRFLYSLTPRGRRLAEGVRRLSELRAPAHA